MHEDYKTYDATGLSQLMRDGKVSPKEVLEAAIQYAEAAKPELNAIVTPLYEYAQARVADAFRSEPTLAGVPFLLKDAHHALAGTPMSNGSRLQMGEVSTESAEIVSRYLDAGLVVIGKTNTPEFKLSVTTNPKAWGPTRNPWDLSRTPGGSSGGSAAAVAAGIVPMASATDEGGSIRIPASCCGVFGLKPSRGRNPVGPDFRKWHSLGLSTSHVVSRTVRDSAAALDATSGPEPGSPDTAAGRGGFVAALAEPLGKLRIGVSTEGAVFGRRIDAPYIDAIRSTATLLQEAGHEVEEVCLPFDETEAVRITVTCLAAHMAGFLRDLEEAYGVSRVQTGVEPGTRFAGELGRLIPLESFIRSRFRILDLGRRMARFHETYDVLITSTLGRVPPRIEDAEPSALTPSLEPVTTRVENLLARGPKALDELIEEQVELETGRLLHRTTLANLTGQPAMSLPLHRTESGLPIGVQVFGRVGDERTLLRLAAQLEHAKPWTTVAT